MAIVTSEFSNALAMAYIKGVSMRVLSQMSGLNESEIKECLESQGINTSIPAIEYNIAFRGISRIKKYLALDNDISNVAKLLDIHCEAVAWALSWNEIKEGIAV